jgi:hypothetical protein
MNSDFIREPEASNVNRVFSNGPSRDFVLKPYERLISKSKHLYIAAPYVTKTDELVQAARAGKSVDLLVGLNAATNPQALSAVHGLPNLAVRYLTRNFHAKIYIFDHREGLLRGKSGRPPQPRRATAVRPSAVVQRSFSGRRGRNLDGR